jgi:hypothetical protein
MIARLEALMLANNNDFLEGGCVYSHLTMKPIPELIPKQRNLAKCGRLYGIDRIAEIGFNAGHSAVMLLESLRSRALTYTLFDICEHAYTKPCLEVVRSEFPLVTFELIEGDSRITLPIWANVNLQRAQTYDIVHVDGGHDMSCLVTDIAFGSLLVRSGGVMIVDDTDQAHINAITDGYVRSGLFVDISDCKEFEKTTNLRHRILLRR